MLNNVKVTEKNIKKTKKIKTKNNVITEFISNRLKSA
jgi:hypothetical protein